MKGTPTDCVIMGVRHILDGNGADLVLSGVNRGRNAAEDVTYSGTVAGAMEGTVLGIPSFALSQAYRSGNRAQPHWETAIKFAPDLIRRVLQTGIPRDVLVNINFPGLPARRGARDCGRRRQGKRDQELLRIEPRNDGRGNPYFWIAFARGEMPNLPNGTDLAALADNRISVTPLRLDLTDEPFMTKLAGLFARQASVAARLGYALLPSPHERAECLAADLRAGTASAASAARDSVSGKPRLAIAGREHERHAARDRSSATGKTVSPSRLTSRMATSNSASSPTIASASSTLPATAADAVAEIVEHVLQQHADHEFVLDDEHAPGRAGCLRALRSGRIHSLPPVNSGISKLQSSPCSREFHLHLPSASLRESPRISRDPKPLRVGSFTGGPPVSAQIDAQADRAVL